MINYWDSVYDQERIITQLKIICETRRAPHAFIFSGKEGVGKFNVAVQFIKSLVKTVDPNISDLTLKKISELQEPFIKLILPLPRGKGETSDDSGVERLTKETIDEIQSEIKKKSFNPYHKILIENANTIKISSIREIGKFLTNSHNEDIPRFVIINDAHLMNDQSQNALLKNLEEPPPGIIFIIITSERDSLLPTIISRCRELNFQPLKISSIEKVLVEHFAVDKKLAHKLSYLSEGSISTALSLMNYDIDTTFEKTISILRYSFAKRYQTAISELNEFANNNSTESLTFLLRMIRTWLVDAIKNRNLLNEYFFENFRDTFEKFNQRYHDIDLSIPFSRLENLEKAIQRNINLNVLFLNIIFEISAVVKRV